MNPLDARRRILGKGVYKKTVEGNPAIAQGSLARRCPGITMQGWTEQEQYEGNQLFDKTGIELTNMPLYIPINVGDGQFTLSTLYLNNERKDVFFLPGNVVVGASSSTNGVDRNTTRTVSSEDGYVTVALRLNSEGDMNPLDYNIMLNEGSSALPYEPYTGGAPSPSPDYKQDVKNAGKYNEETQKYEYQVKLTGANLFDASRIRNLNSGNNCPDEYRINGNEIVARKSGGTINQMVLEIGLSLKPGNYYFTYDSMEITNQNGETYSINSFISSSIRETASGDVVVSYSLAVPGDYIKVTIENDIDMYLALSAMHEWESISELKIYGLRIVSNADTPFEPYKSPQTVTLTSDRPLTKWDKLEKRNDQWGWVYKSAEVVLDGSADENWMNQADSKGKIQFYITLYDALFPYSELFKKMFYCDTFMTTNNSGTIPNWQVRRGTYNTLLAPVFKPSDDINRLDLFRDFLAENPTTILYVTAEETFVPLSESEQEQMNALYTFRPTTVLSNDCECNMGLTYKTKKSLEVTT